LSKAQTAYQQLTPWKPESLCPCKSGKRYGGCCSSLSGLPLLKSESIVPSGEVTGYAHPNCYMKGTCNCSEKISREHFISKSVLTQCSSGDETKVKVRGIFWQEAGRQQDIAVNALASNILCARHNNSLSPLDTVAGTFFSAVRKAGNFTRRRDVQKDLLFLLNGNSFERWGVKTALGVYHSKHVRAGGKCIADNFHLDDQPAVNCLEGGMLSSPLGMYVMAKENNLEHDFAIAPLTHKLSHRYLGVEIQMRFVHLMFVIDPDEGETMRQYNPVHYRTNNLEITGLKVKASIWLTWSGAREVKQMLYKSE
jgi:hypothetical protein